MNEQDHKLMENLNQHPILRQRMEALLSVVNNAEGDCIKASEAEQHVINELRQMGNDALNCWASKAVETSVQQAHQTHTGLQSDGQKNSIGIAPSEK